MALTNDQKKKTITLGGLATFKDEMDGAIANLFTGEETRTESTYYKKPSGGIPKTDLATAVQNALTAAGTALQPADLTTLNNKVSALEAYFDSSADSDTIINKWNEIVAFLNGIAESSTLSGLLNDLSTQISAKYTKPSGGIPKTDLASAVQTSLGKADTALQSAPVTSVAGKTGAVTLGKSDVGLGSVVNTGDSATPVSGGTTKFTTGGAYTELAKKVGKTEEITWANLKSKRDNSQLVPGQWYRITDYQTTTTQVNTQSAGHQFDIIVRADDVNVLNENAFAAKHSGDTYFTNAGAKLEAWQLKYTLDNKYWSLAPHGEQITNYSAVYEYEGTEEINSTTYYKWYRIDYTSTKRYTLGKSVGDTVYLYRGGSILSEDGTIGSYIPASDANGKGTIYWMKDEFNNECSYDFKNIQFKFTSAIENSGIVANVFYYTFSFASGDNDATITDHSLVKYCIRNKVIYMEEDNDNVKLPFNVFRCNSASERFTKNIIIGRNINNTFSSAQYNEIIGTGCNDNSFGNGCFNNKIYGTECSRNKFYEGCVSNSMIGQSKSNVLGARSSSNKFENGRSITLGAKCEFNTFKFGCYQISLGERCRYNTFGKSCMNITFGTSESTKSYCQFIIVENGNKYIYLDCSATTSSSNYFQNVKIAQGVNNTTTTKTISHNTVNDTFQTVYQPANSQTISV